MTTGDEKVVAWQQRYLGSSGDWSNWILVSEDTNHGEPDPEWETRGLIPQSAYAELAAERDSLRSAGLYTANRLAEAESQLAELRGSLEERCVMLDGLAGVIRQYGLCAPSALEEVAKQIRTLAAADGG